MATTAKTQLWDVIAVNIKANTVRIFDERQTFENAEAVSRMAIMRRGCDEEFYTEVHTGTYKDGDRYDPALGRTNPAPPNP